MSEVAKKQENLSPAQRFAEGVIKQIKIDGGVFTDKMKMLSQSYFVKLDSVLKDSQLKAKQDDLPYKWENVNIEKLTRDVSHFAKTGLNPLMKNHIFPIPYKNNKTSKYDITFIPGYEGIKTVAKKYALDEFIDGIVHLVHENDIFKPMFKSASNEFDTYEFEVTQPFNRGEIIGGFYYQMYSDKSKNKLAIYTLEEIEKRKPKNASPEFWGGQKDEWKDGKRTGNKIQIEGWYREMLLKTLERLCFEKVTKDGDKIDAEFLEFNKAVEKSDELTFQQPKTEDAEATVLENKQAQSELVEVDPFENIKKGPVEIQSEMELEDLGDL